ncbi:class I SAM-dependent methyltransferase [Mycobacterium sp.]|jgi:methyltransferase (TIGR00027 family)|uniref:class I SAM-dependent methyltransferase n=1 Tax=Mycobacterium sp. TaxID=1785 RepID=UPI002D3E133A|nr:class I SAM-dependent methyltransferase [Mycobacterium sp.]HZA12408.1 class I SAM-dependent methyltransferase [Mycobacterium sp.]
MARTDNDTWDLATSVGATATGVAVGRALASRASNPLIDDPFAEPLVRAVGVDFFTRLASGELDPAEVDGDSPWGMQRMTDMMAVRTRFFDEFFTDATRAGIRQAVILASGLDARAYRLPWPDGTTVYEIDQPQVIEFKSATLARLDAAPTADRRPVAIDLRQDWPAALRQAGFDSSRPTAWSAEGLLAFLPPDAQDRLLDNLTALSAASSRFASENMPSSSQFHTEMQQRMRAATQNWRRHGFDIDMTELGYPGDRAEVAGYLGSHGWETATTKVADLYAAAGLAMPTENDEMAALRESFTFVTATRT